MSRLWPAALLLLFVTILSSPASAAPAPASKTWTTGSHLGFGFGFFSAGDTQQPGVSLEGGARFVHRSGFTVSLIGELALTEFSRVKQAATAGLDVAKWSLGGFGSVTDWIGNGSGDNTTFFRGFAGFFAYTFLTVTLITGGVLLLFSPVAAFTNLQTAMAVGYTLDLGAVSLRGEGGLGALFYWHPRDNNGYTGWGPMAGMEVDIDGYGIGIRAVYSPRVMHSSDDDHVFVGTATFRAIY